MATSGQGTSPPQSPGVSGGESDGIVGQDLEILSNSDQLSNVAVGNSPVNMLNPVNQNDFLPISPNPFSPASNPTVRGVQEEVAKLGEKLTELEKLANKQVTELEKLANIQRENGEKQLGILEKILFVLTKTEPESQAKAPKRHLEEEDTVAKKIARMENDTADEAVKNGSAEESTTESKPETNGNHEVAPAKGEEAKADTGAKEKDESVVVGEGTAV
ncbi:uncharacterized protein LOC129584940 [Paramacrobiotus metropolitanus]|uniref:uncharacterized protein LOC129584940 n=1 Tax=Paramacrobiotus metropolitanus TaxID=2943436 RepID=UPI0024463443|nr:uncharacterized protein LOC129584940 [Paramacrobiotus metropolitanus]XP_055333357.1 uncharacterized protein LOC129584940 [Paramacrobiotus metropolitanus]